VLAGKAAMCYIRHCRNRARRSLLWGAHI